MIKSDYIAAHKHSSNHRDELEGSELCGCFYCLTIFRVMEIDKWIDDEKTALCPYCAIDSVIGSGSRYPITKEFLSMMHKHWF